MMSELDQIKEQIDEATGIRDFGNKVMVGAASGIGAGVVAGYVLWALRGISLISSAISTMPLWRFFDPLPVLTHRRKKDKDEKDSSPDEEQEVGNIFG